MTEYMQGKFVPQNPQKYIGDPRNIVYRSSWEFKAMRWFDMNPDIERWGSEEFTIPYLSPVDRQIHRYFPDFVVKIKQANGTSKVAVLEVKPARQTQPPKQTKRKRRSTIIREAQEYAVNQAKWDAAKHFCEDRGWQFMVLTEHHLFPKAP